MTRCQICGRRKGLRKDGTVVFHHVDSDPCPGRGFRPIEHDDGRLVQYAGAITKAFDDVRGQIRALEEARANYIEPALTSRRAALAKLSLKVNGRLRRHMEWPERYRRSMDRKMAKFGYAWSDPPPDYLILRDREVRERAWLMPGLNAA